MSKRILLTDCLFPNKYARWRLVEIYSFMKDHDTDILVVNKFTNYNIIKYEFDYDILSDKFGLNNYDILIFNPEYNYINKFNNGFDGTKYNNKFPCDYLFQHSKFRDIPFNIANYDIVYHIFLSMYTQFNNIFKFEYKKQFIHLYPGGGYWGDNDINSIHPDVNLIPTQQFISKVITKNSFLNIYGGPFFENNEVINKKKIKDTLCICFTSLGEPISKGADTYIKIVKLFYNKYSDKDITFISIGICPKSIYIKKYEPMDQLELSKFYNKNVDIIISLDSGITLNGFPLGIESVIEGCILLTTDVHNQNILNNFNLEPFFIVNKDNLQDIVDKILFLKKKKNRETKINLLQKKIYNLFNYNNTTKLVYQYINMMEIYSSLVKDSGGAFPINKLMYIYNYFIRDKNIKTIVEIGVYNGCFLLPITFMNNNILSYGIDPYTSYIQNDIDDKKIYNLALSIITDVNFLNNTYNRLLDNINKFKLNVKIFRDTSKNSVSNFDNDSIDILNIDGNHDYENVLKDLSLYEIKIKKDGIIILNNINWESIKSALNKFLSLHNNFKIIYEESELCIIRKF